MSGPQAKPEPEATGARPNSALSGRTGNALALRSSFFGSRVCTVVSRPRQRRDGWSHRTAAVTVRLWPRSPTRQRTHGMERRRRALLRWCRRTRGMGRCIRCGAGCARAIRCLRKLTSSISVQLETRPLHSNGLRGREREMCNEFL
jgi:hypothetical protein